MTHLLIYVSRSLVGTHADVLATILATSTACNDLSGITGMLWWGADTFAQVLEGSSEAVAATMGRIEADPRHTDIEVVEDRDVVSRMFGEWAMAQADDSASGIAATSFLVGFCAGRKDHSAQRLLNFLVTHA